MVLEKISTTSIGFIDARKCDIFGAGKIGGAVIQSAANAAISAATNATNASIAAKTNKTNKQMNEDTNAANERINQYTNDKNLQIAQEANETNIQMMREQNDWNENMWNKQNEYNSPEAQMQRLVDAGINPVMALSNGMGNASGNSSNLPQSAQFAGAEVAHMNPVHLQAGHIDPYKLIPFDIDFLSPLSQAAGIKSQMLDNKIKEVEANFTPQLYGSKLEMQEAMTKHVIAQTEDLSKTQLKRLQKLGLDIKLAQLLEKSMQQELESRKEEFAFVKQMRPHQLEQLRANLEHTYASIVHMKAEEVYMKAQERHLINQDEFNEGMLKVQQRFASAAEQNANTNESAQLDNAQLHDAQTAKLRSELLLSGFETAFKYVNMRRDTRAAFAKYLSKIQDGDTFKADLKLLMDGLVPAASEGTFSKFFLDVLNAYPYPEEYSAHPVPE